MVSEPAHKQKGGKKMARRLLSFGVSVVLFFGLVSPTFALEKIKFATSVKLFPPYYLAVLAAQEKGIFGQNGLEAEWVSFEGGGPFMRALVARAIFVGYAGTADAIHAASRG